MLGQLLQTLRRAASERRNALCAAWTQRVTAGVEPLFHSEISVKWLLRLQTLRLFGICTWK